MIVMRDPKTFYFYFDFIINSKKFLAENKIKNNEIEQLWSKYKRGSDIHEHGKQ